MELELPKDFKELLKLFNSNKVSYLIIGGYAVIMHGYPRFTSDLDIAIGSDAENISRCLAALRDFGFDEPAIGPESFSGSDRLVRLGVEPLKVEILNYLKGLDFYEAYAHRIVRSVEDIEISVISLEDLIINKSSVDRLKDRLDVEELRERNELK